MGGGFFNSLFLFNYSFEENFPLFWLKKLKFSIKKIFPKISKTKGGTLNIFYFLGLAIKTHRKKSDYYYFFLAQAFPAAPLLLLPFVWHKNPSLKEN